MLRPNPDDSFLAFRLWMVSIGVVGLAGVALIVHFVGVVVYALASSAKTTASAASRDSMVATVDKFQTFKKKTFVSLLAVLLPVWLLIHPWAVLQLPYLVAVCVSGHQLWGPLNCNSVFRPGLFSGGDVCRDFNSKSTVEP
jgi:hypothetical protein